MQYTESPSCLQEVESPYTKAMSRNQLILNRYAPLAEAGSGGFATVQVAWDTRIQRKVAIKCIRLDDLPPSGADATAVIGADADATVSLGGVEGGGNRFADARRDGAGSGDDDYAAAMRSYLGVPGLDEARTAALLNDQSIVSVYDFEVQGTTAYLIMEYVEGLTLTQLLASFGDELTLDIVAAVFEGVARALEVAHENQVLHLDIKPDNILINKKGQVKVTDFGLAQLAGFGGFGTAGGGTIGYMPLEQMRGELLDVRCDEWALASVTYEMLAGENPFFAKSLAQAEKAIEDAELVLPSLCWDDLDSQADDVLFYALDPDRTERYESVADFAEEMTKFLGDAKRGRRQLSALTTDAESAQELSEDERHRGKPALESVEDAPFGERIGSTARTVLGRAVAAAGSALVAGLGLWNIPGLSGVSNPLFWGILAVACILAAMLPSIGALTAFIILAAALVAHGAFAQGCLLVIAAGVWWWFVGRRGTAQANVALAAPVAGAVGAACLAPLAAGRVLRPFQAMASALFAAYVSFALATLGSGSLQGWDALSLWDFTGGGAAGLAKGMVLSPRTWIVVAGWVVAAGASAACCLRGLRALSLLGTLAAGAVLVAAACCAEAVGEPGLFAAPPAEQFAAILLCTLCVAALAWAVPPRPPVKEADGHLARHPCRERRAR